MGVRIIEGMRFEVQRVDARVSGGAPECEMHYHFVDHEPVTADEFARRLAGVTGWTYRGSQYSPPAPYKCAWCGNEWPAHIRRCVTCGAYTAITTKVRP